MTIDEIRSYIEIIIDPTRGRSLKELNAIKHIGINEEKDSVVLIVEIGKKGGKAEDFLRRELARVVKIGLGFSGIKIQFEESKEANLIAGRNTKYIIVSNSKGGVGKSTVTINLAYALKEMGKKVAIIDTDIYNPTIPLLLNMEDQSPEVNEANKIIPFNKNGIEVISTYFFSEKESPLLWQGNMLSSMLTNLLYQVSYSRDLDYVLIDTMPGTGDSFLYLGEQLTYAEALIVSEDTLVSAIASLKTIKAHESKNQNVIGIVINKYNGLNDGISYLQDKTDYEILTKIDNQVINSDNLYTDYAKQSIIDLATLLSIRD